MKNNNAMKKIAICAVATLMLAVCALSLCACDNGTSFSKDTRFKVDLSHSSVMGFQLGETPFPAIFDIAIDADNTYAEFKTDGTMHFQVRTAAGLFGETLDTLLGAVGTLLPNFTKDAIGEMIANFDIEGGVDSMVEPMFPGFRSKLESGDLDGALKLIQTSLGFYIDGLDYTDDGVKQILDHVAQNMALPENLLELIPADTVLTLHFDNKYYVKKVKGKDGKKHTAVYISEIGGRSDVTQPWCVFDMTTEGKGRKAKKKLYFKAEFMNAEVSFVQQ